MMSQFTCFTVVINGSEDLAWQELSELGIELLYSTQDTNGQIEIYGNMSKKLSKNKVLKQCPTIESCKTATLPEIDWEDQWASHGLDYHDGYVHIDLAKYSVKNSKILLQPGPGFGDLSHPSTLLVLSLMQNHVKERVVVDIGIGSGVLACCAVAMGAKYVYGIDIDTGAVDHARRNAQLNGMQDQISVDLEWKDQNKFGEGIVVVMNMIHSEQVEAWTALPHIHSLVTDCITSGILETERDQYIEHCRQWGWILKEEQVLDGWLGCYFVVSRSFIGDGSTTMPSSSHKNREKK